MHFIVRLLEDRLDEEGVLGQPLPGHDEEINQSEALAVLVVFAPLNKQKKHLKKWFISLLF